MLTIKRSVQVCIALLFVAASPRHAAAIKWEVNRVFPASKQSLSSIYGKVKSGHRLKSYSIVCCKDKNIDGAVQSLGGHDQRQSGVFDIEKIKKDPRVNSSDAVFILDHEQCTYCNKIARSSNSKVVKDAKERLGDTYSNFKQAMRRFDPTRMPYRPKYKDVGTEKIVEKLGNYLEKHEFGTQGNQTKFVRLASDFWGQHIVDKTAEELAEYFKETDKDIAVITGTLLSGQNGEFSKMDIRNGITFLP